jgi:hypothetical protein
VFGIAGSGRGKLEADAGIRKIEGLSGASLVAGIGAFVLASPADDHSTECADDADERPAVVTGISLRCALLVAAGSANHRVAFAEDLAH